MENKITIQNKISKIMDSNAREDDYYDLDKAEWDNLSFDEKFDYWETYNDIEDYLDEFGIKLYQNYLELSDSHVLWNINNESFEKLDPEDWADFYWHEVDAWLANFEDDMQRQDLLEGEVGYLGRSSRHIVIDKCVKNILNYDRIKTAYEELEKDFIEYLNNYTFEEDND